MWLGLVRFERSWSCVGNAGIWFSVMLIFRRQRSLILCEIRHVTVLFGRCPRNQFPFLNLFGERSGFDFKKFFFYWWMYFCISIGWMYRAYMNSDVFYSFCFKPSSKQHPVNFTFFFKWKLRLWCFYLFLYVFILLVSWLELYHSIRGDFYI